MTLLHFYKPNVFLFFGYICYDLLNLILNLRVHPWVLGVREDRLTGTVLFGTYNLCCGRDIGKIYFKYTLVYGELKSSCIVMCLNARNY